MPDSHHFHFIHFSLNRQLSGLYLTAFIRTLALSMIGIFVPIYLLKELGYPLATILVYYIFRHVMFGTFSIFSAKTSSKAGVKHTILMSIPLYILFFGLLYSIKDYNIPLFSIALIGALADSLFWVPFHADFAKSSDKKHRGEEVGIWQSFSIFFAVLGPLIGGLILTFYNFNVLFVIVGTLLLGSVAPLFFSSEIYEKRPFSFRQVFKKNHIKDTPPYLGHGIMSVGGGLIWPIFIFFLLKGYFALGAISSVSSLFVACFTLFVGRISDSFKKDQFIFIGSILTSFVWFFKVFVKTLYQIASISIAAGLAYTIVDVPFSAKVYDKANKSRTIGYFVFREIALSLGRIMLLLVVLIGSSWISMDSLKLGIVVISLTALLHAFF